MQNRNLAALNQYGCKNARDAERPSAAGKNNTPESEEDEVADSGGKTAALGRMASHAHSIQGFWRETLICPSATCS